VTEPYRSLLFARADDRDALAAALASDADAVVADLESAVSDARKAAARDVVADAFGAADGGPARLVRVNALHSPHHPDDAALVRALPLDAVVVPHATPDAVRALGDAGAPVIAVVETAVGLRAAYDIGVQRRVVGLALGANDLALDLGLGRSDDGRELLYARSKLVVDAVAAGVPMIFDRVHADGTGLEEDARAGRALGFRGKSTLAPDHVRVINDVFAR
jgi:citrate lyase subunit beta/citryl-CoA lyase